jgi:hypothetical protein
VISEATAKTHVARILQKLDLRDRVQAVIYAYETRFVAPGVPHSLSAAGDVVELFGSAQCMAPLRRLRIRGTAG